MKESYREGVTNHPGPEPCEGGRKAALEALDRGICRMGIELRNRTNRDAHGVIMPEGNTAACANVSAQWSRGVEDPRHAEKLQAREPEPGKQAKRAGACARSSKEERETEVHRSAAPCKHRPTAEKLLQPKETGGAGSGRDDMGRVWTRPGGAACRPARTNPSWSLSSATIAKSLDTESRWAAAPTGGRGTGG